LKGKLLALNHATIFFGATLYCGVLWALRFFWFPTWTHLTLANYYDQFVPETLAATRFFTVVVPIMFLCCLIMVVTEWRGRLRWAAIAAFVCLIAATIVGQAYIIPVNKIIDAGVKDQAQLTSLLQRWMSLNDIRFVLLTIMWVVMMYYFIARGKLTDVLESPAA
jgi:glucan phosphoethanolaminetransferase (alkaline phosphatase superfamily)